MKTLQQLNSELFKLVKDNGSIHYTKLYELIEDASEEEIDLSRNTLILEYKLVSKGHNFKLTEKGLKYESFESYLNSLEPKKEYWLTKYQIIYLLFFIFFGFFGVYKYFDNKELKSQYKTLKYQHKILKSDFDSLKAKYDSVTIQTKQLPKQILNDSLKTKNVSE